MGFIVIIFLNNNVLDYEVDNWKIWGIIRVYIYSHMITERDEFNNSTSNKKTIAINVLEKLPAAVNYLKSLIHFFIILHSYLLVFLPLSLHF